VFGEGTFHISDTLDLTVGLRQHDQSGYSQNGAAIAGVTAPKPLDPTQFHVGGDPFAMTLVGIPNEFEFDKLTSRLALQKQFTDNFMGYISYSEGFNSGGISAPTINGVRTEFPYDPSTLENFEIGIRTDLANGKLRFNATIFDTVWADLQAAGVVTVNGIQVSRSSRRTSVKPPPRASSSSSRTFRSTACSSTWAWAS
jgi:iron complex outermembrane receptor protein